MPDTNAPSLAQRCYDAYAEALALPWTHAYADLPAHLRTAWEAVAAAMEAYWREGEPHADRLD